MKHIKHILLLILTTSITINAQIDISKILFENGEYFEEKSTIISIGIGLSDNIQLDSIVESSENIELNSSLPSLSLFIEKQVHQNIGAELGVSYRQWNVPVFNYKYHYLTTTLRGKYHFNILDVLDPYIGFGLNYRRLSVSNNYGKEANHSFGISYTIGARFYLADQVGVFAEIGDDNNSHIRLGASLYFQ